MKTKPHPLKEIFKKAKVTQLDLERNIGLHQSTISILLSGARTMKPEEEKLFREFADKIKKN
jgi:transcriptional regulator with XRE-family HTH domain